MSSQWYYVRDGQTLGPVSGDMLQQLSRQSALSANDLVWREGMEEWVSASSIGLGTRLNLPLPPPTPISTSAGLIPPIPVISIPPVANRTRNSRRWQPLILCFSILLVIGAVGIWLLESARRSAELDQVDKETVANASEVRRTVAIGSGVNEEDRPQSNLEDRSQPKSGQTGEPTTSLPEATTLKTLKPASGPKEPLAVVAPNLTTPPAAQPALPTSIDDGQKTPATPTSQSTLAVPAAASDSKGASQSAKSSPKVEQKPGDTARRTIFQQIEMLRRPRFSIQGLETAQEIRYQLLSRLDVTPQPDGRREVLQFVQDTRLLAADDLTRATFANSLERLKNQQYTYTLNERGEVSAFAAHKDNLASLRIDLPTAAGFAVTSVIDKDGWKELAELTFLIPDSQTSNKQGWQRPMSHDWGPLGYWSGTTTFKRRGAKKEIQEIEYTHEMIYTKPRDKGGMLPFKIVDARFEPNKAGGRLEFDNERQRVRLAQEVFEVRGVVTAELLGQALEVQLTEQQLIEIRILDQSPGSLKQ